MHVDRTLSQPPQPSTLIGMPSAPITSPLPLEESIAARQVAPAERTERTEEVNGATLATGAAQASFLDGDIPDETQVIECQAEQQAQTQTQLLMRSQMPAALQGAPSRGQTPPPTSVHTPSALAATAAAWPNGRHPEAEHAAVAAVTPGGAAAHASIAPVAVDARVRTTMVSVPAMAAIAAPANRAKSNGLLIGGLVFAAAALVGVVGVGGFLASRTLSDKADAIKNAPSAPESVAAATAAPASPVPAPVTAADPVATAAAAPAAPVAAAPAAAAVTAPSAAEVDVASLPSAPARGAAPTAPRSAPLAAAGAGAGHPSTGPLPPPGAAAPPPPPTGRAGAPLPPPGAAAPPPPPAGRAGAPLPPPGAAAPPNGGPVALPPPPPKAAAAPAVASTTGSVNVDPKLRAVVVDGAFRRVNDGVLTLTCGSHRIKVGMNDPQTVNVPCGGSVSL